MLDISFFIAVLTPALTPLCTKSLSFSYALSPPVHAYKIKKATERACTPIIPKV